MTSKEYWKSLIIRKGKIVSDYDKSEWIVGQWRTNPYTVTKECEGMNCSDRIADAMGYVTCEVLAQVEIRGNAVRGEDKITAQEMRIVKAWAWTKEDSVSLAIYAAELVIDHYEKEYPDDPRPRAAIEASKAWLANPENAATAAADAAANAAAYATYSASDAVYAADDAAYAAARAAAYAASAASYAAKVSDATYSAANAAYYAANAANAAANAAAYAASAAYYAANAVYSAESRVVVKDQIQRWIVARLSYRLPISNVGAGGVQ